MEPQRRLEWPLWLAGLAFAVWLVLSAGPTPPAERSVLATLDAAVTGHVICWGPLLFAAGMVLLVAGIRGFFYVQERRVRLRLGQIEVERARVTLALAQLQIKDPRVFTDAAGRQVLVNPALTTRAVTHIDADTEADSEQLRAALALARAVEHSGWGKRGEGAPADLALTLGARMLPPAERVPNTVRILDADEAQTLPNQ